MEQLNAMSLNVFEYLGSIPNVSHIENKPSPGIHAQNIALWEQRNSPKRLPRDLGAFLSISNGLSVKWYTTLKGKQFWIGHFSLNSLQHMRKIQATFPDGAEHTALVLDSSKTVGEICLVYRTDERSEIWLHDLSSKWVFLAHSFADYYRLMIVHLGLIGWQSLFSTVGLDPLTKQWFHLFVPGRLRQTLSSIEKKPNAKISILPFL